jgi:hypothetical protein
MHHRQRVDDVLVDHRIGGDGLLQQAVKQQAARARAAAVEAEDELIEVIVQMPCLHRSMMGAEDPALQQRGHAMHPGQQLVSATLWEPSRTVGRWS